MNCPSRTDDDELFFRPGWNQNPPRFAADLTTCQDMNGIANARELGEADRLCSGLRGFRSCELETDFQEMERKESVAMGEGVKGSPKAGPCTRTTASHVSEYEAGLSATATNWMTWLASVLCTSIVISYASGGISVGTFSMSSGNKTTRHFRRSTCENGRAQPNYNLPLHIAGLFIILFVSGSACAFPVLVLKFPRLRIPASFLFGAKHFGTGVLIATAFVHLLPTAFLSLSNPCLSSFWVTDYRAMPGAIMLASIFFVTIIEMVFSPAQHVCGGNEGVAAVSRKTEEQIPQKFKPQNRPAPQEATKKTHTDSSMRVRNLSILNGRIGSISRTLSRYRERGQRVNSIESAESKLEAPAANSKHESEEYAAEEDHGSGQQNHVLTPEQQHKKAIMQCFLLEMGILFHSVFIGMSLAVSVGSDYTVLLIAIIFHQTFEGLALGVRIADIKWEQRALQPWLMALAYGCTTPLGMAIGIATHTLYSPNSEIGLLVVGIMNAVSAGFLVFASLVELMSEDFLSDESWQILRGRKRVIACLLVFFGAFLMSLVGAWA
ncbi:Zip-domain-containing protein [Clathrospora elynae]|uniref:Zip-domain-containing protein n=1 Tax=Clathrospora elynae TaxID=706981 RepID=A0A6A5SCI8_9PLEO|nr:Zip-domain-containing protein [Clathrospora elynae]